MSTSKRRRFPGAVSRLLAWIALLVAVLLLAYAANAIAGIRSTARTSGTLRVAGLQAPVTIARDDRGIPHIRAANQHDLFFAQGYAEASDRLFQMDLIRRYVSGTLSEVMGPGALPADEHARLVPIDRVVRAQWLQLDEGDRLTLQAFSDGVNAAMKQQPLPVEFRLLLYKPRPWTPQDSLVVSFSTVLDLIDTWDDVIRRDGVLRRTHLPPDTLYPITDPAYDAPVSGVPAPVASIAPRAATKTSAGDAAAIFSPSSDRASDASNNWAAGAARTAAGHALLANDPHLRVGIPGVWYLLEMRAPGFHAAGASLPGTPGIVLGHNEHIAWAATNGTVTTEVVYHDTPAGATRRAETFHVRFGKDVTVTYYETRHGFVVRKNGSDVIAVDWNAVRFPRAPLATFSLLDRAGSIREAIAGLRTYPGPPQNFVLAGVDGTAAYHLAGLIPQDPSWGMRVHAERDPAYRFVPFDMLPHVDPSRGALVFTSNNRTYGRGYPYRLASANFAAPYRAFRVHELLEQTRRLRPQDLAAIQLDTYSIPEYELAQAAVRAFDRSAPTVRNDAGLYAFTQRLRAWNGRFDPESGGAPAANALRRNAVAMLDTTIDSKNEYSVSAGNADLMLLMRLIRERPRGWAASGDAFLIGAMRKAARDPSASGTWSNAGSVAVNHPLAALGVTFLNSAALPGDGDAFAVRVLSRPAHAQSFRAVWDTGNWDAGGIAIPSGESGRPGSGRYTDLRGAWLSGALKPLPFTDAAVRRAVQNVLTLTP